MTIYRGPGGTGSATSDADTTLYQDFLNQTIAARDAALQAETNAELAETNAETAEANAETAEANAAASASAAATSASNASTSASNAASSASSASSSASAASTSASEAAGYATSINPADLVHISGTETITGAKTFSQTITGSITGNAGTVTNGVYTTGDQTIAGTKTFSSNPILSAGTANGLAFLNASKVLTTGSALTFDGTNLGIGTSSPAAKLDVSGTSRIRTDVSSATVIATATNAAANAYATYRIDSNDYQFYTTGSEKMRIDSSGNVGIGTSSPAAKLQVVGNTVSSNLYFGTVTGSAGTLASDTGNSGGRIVLWGSTSPGAGLIQIGTNAAAAITFETSNTERARIDSSGNFSIGTSGATTKFNVAAANPTNGAIALIQNTSTSAQTGALLWLDVGNVGSSAVGIPGGSSNALAFYVGGVTSASERARIDSSGNLLVGTTTAEGKLGISGIGGSGYASIFVRGFGDGIGYGAIFQVASGAYNGTGRIDFRNTSGSGVGQIVISSSSVSYNTSSDYRLKENIQPMTGALAKVAALKPCTYKWKADGSDGEGFIAHELAEVVPQCVTGEKDAVDADGNPQYQGIDTSFLVATLTAAIQEQQAIIQQLQAEVAALKGQA